MSDQIKILHILFLSVLVLLFQNCIRGFHLDESDPNELSLGSSGGPTFYEKSLSELQPFNIKIAGSETVSFSGTLPTGVLFDSAARKLYWIPAKGQSGDHSFSIQAEGVDKIRMTFHVLPLDDFRLRYGGPPFSYQDGDVGYVFVHGLAMKDLCAERASLDVYWGNSPQVLAPDPANRTVACYDGRNAVATVAESVARQILGAGCGLHKKCIIITHSMGGLLMEHMFLHTRAPKPSDPVQAWYGPSELYKAVREKTLFVISLASAAGGSKTADLVYGNAGNLGQDAIGVISRWMGADTEATANLRVGYASRVVAPFSEDPEVPFFMVPGYTYKSLYEESGFFGSIFDVLVNSVPDTVFNANRELTFIDGITSFPARSDGVVDFRSGCGVASDDPSDGVGASASLDDHFHYCWGAPKKANHYLWFAVNLNHGLITLPAMDDPACGSPKNPCTPRFPASIGTLIADDSLRGLAAIDVIRNKVGRPLTSPVMGKRSLAGY